jgi:hypothetical protein
MTERRKRNLHERMPRGAELHIQPIVERESSAQFVLVENTVPVLYLGARIICIPWMRVRCGEHRVSVGYMRPSQRAWSRSVGGMRRDQARCVAPVRRDTKKWCEAEITSFAPFFPTCSFQKASICCGANCQLGMVTWDGNLVRLAGVQPVTVGVQLS